ncbi:MAG TPA: hypothetical protein VIE65_03180, partial [Methylobacter sp.]
MKATSNAASVLPESCDDATEREHNNIVISSIEHDDYSTVISRYGDTTWDFSPFIPNANWHARKKIVDWSTFPSPFISGAKSTAHAYWSTGTVGRKRPQATTVISFITCIRTFAQWLAAHHVTRFADVRPLHCQAYAQDSLSKGLRPNRRVHLLSAIELIYSLRSKSTDPMPSHPWPNSSAKSLCGMNGKRDATDPRTEIIPRHILQVLFERAEATLDQADAILEERAREGSKRQHRNKKMIRLRNACYFLIAITTGCRNHELASIEIGAALTTINDDETYHWLKGVSLKTAAGATEWMMPEIGVRAVSVMERWSAPSRSQIDAELSMLQAKLAALEPSERPAATLQKQAQLRIDRNRLFLGYA